jgi:hypothetical protein
VTIQRDLFYGYDTLMENVSDPSHIEFAHHKVRSAVLLFENSYALHTPKKVMPSVVTLRLKRDILLH